MTDETQQSELVLMNQMSKEQLAEIMAELVWRNHLSLSHRFDYGF